MSKLKIVVSKNIKCLIKNKCIRVSEKAIGYEGPFQLETISGLLYHYFLIALLILVSNIQNVNSMQKAHINQCF